MDGEQYHLYDKQYCRYGLLSINMQIYSHRHPTKEVEPGILCSHRGRSVRLRRDQRLARSAVIRPASGPPTAPSPKRWSMKIRLCPISGRFPEKRTGSTEDSRLKSQPGFGITRVPPITWLHSLDHYWRFPGWPGIDRTRWPDSTLRKSRQISGPVHCFGRNGS